MPKISMIAAMAKGRVIGANNAMPWHLPADLKHFKQTTLGKPVIMGRKTYESIGKALPGRRNIVVSRSGFHCDDAVVVDSVEQALGAAGEEGTHGLSPDEIMIIGGGALYKLCLPFVERLYLTFIDLEVPGDTYFPDYEQTAIWKKVESVEHLCDEKNPFNYEFVTLEKS